MLVFIECQCPTPWSPYLSVYIVLPRQYDDSWYSAGALCSGGDGSLPSTSRWSGSVQAECSVVQTGSRSQTCGGDLAACHDSTHDHRTVTELLEDDLLVLSLLDLCCLSVVLNCCFYVVKIQNKRQYIANRSRGHNRAVFTDWTKCMILCFIVF